MGIARDDKPMRQDWVLRGFRQFDAPVSLVLTVREVANIPEDEVIMTCVAMGYPDDSFPANAVRSDREPNGDFVRYVGFAD
jgi:hypothetical protein